ncbi:MAG TPA: methyltransferase domain-containing protein [Patescibacteria group bacterium]|nr:methyltransferase domain-containing protein [Patescibacteria group bacterium]
MTSPAPLSAEELLATGRALLQAGDLDGAQASFEGALKIAPSAAGWRGLGNIHFMRRNYRASVPLFEKALDVDAQDHPALAMLAEAYFELGQRNEAVGYSTLAVSANPAEIRYKERFLVVAQEAVFLQHNIVIENTLLTCLETPGLDCAGAQGLWYNLFTLNPVYRAFFAVKRSTEKSGGLFGRIRDKMSATLPARDDASVHFDPTPLDAATDFSPLTSPFFLLGLEKIVVYTAAFEEFLTHLRKALLLQPSRFTPAQLIAIAARLAQYAYNTDYILNVTPEETAALGKLGDGAADLARRACYAPLHFPAVSPELEGVAVFSTLVQQQISEPRDREKAAAGITAITPIDDVVSVKVREQYEESPYPRWKSVPRNLTIEAVANDLRKPGAKILIAGCGTGQEAAQIATVLPEAEILAVDLSLASLSYAKVQTEKLGFKNITFRQADILQLGALQERFDGIVSGGVLHHLRDPLKGWEILTGLLKPNGLMRIALYSKTARRHLVVAQQVIKEKAFPPTPEGMRDFRRQSASLLDKEVLNAISAVSDYYHISMYRDMLFHVQEHCFDIPGIESALKQLHLKFLKFILPQAVTAQYVAAFPGDPEAVSLANWDKFEQAHPQLFIGMYQFWCQKQ